MNKAALRAFAIEARKKLIASVKDKAGRIGITRDAITTPLSEGEGYAIYPTHFGSEAKLTGKEVKQRENLVSLITSCGYDVVMEEAACTWFSRLITIRFMEVNGYLPTRIRVLSSETAGKFEPDIVTQAPDIDLALSPQEKADIIFLKEKNAMDELFRMLFIKQCNELGKQLPGLFENTAEENGDYTEILLDISYTREDDVIRDLLKIGEAEFLEAAGDASTVEVIGWLYQYYNEERKNEVINVFKGVVRKQDIPAATQLFTTDWVVRYMVDNSLGRYWLERNPQSRLKQKLTYLLPGELVPAAEHISPEEITFLDPCMGSGHILVYAFDVLMHIYEECGYSQRDAAKLILEKNLFGLDIDDRAYQLAYFAVMMKARKYNRKILQEGIDPRICSIQESDGLVSSEGELSRLGLTGAHAQTAAHLLRCFTNAKEFGSLITVEPRDYEGLAKRMETIRREGSFDFFTGTWVQNTTGRLQALVKQAVIMTQRYHIVATNPPYLNRMDSALKRFVLTNFRDYAGDLFSVFIYRNFGFVKPGGYCAYMTPFVWMFIKSYEKLREFLIANKSVVSLIQMEYSAFEEATVPICAFVLQNGQEVKRGTYLKLSEFKGGMEAQKQKVLEGIDHPECPYMFYTDAKSFSKIPGMPIAYWVSDRIRQAFQDGAMLGSLAAPRQGLATGNNDRFLRLWHEVEITKVGFGCESRESARESRKKWFPYNKGGDFRKWYGNNEYVVNWENDGLAIRNFTDERGRQCSRPQNTAYFFQPSITWSFISSAKFGVRYSPPGAIFDVGGSSVFAEQDKIKFFTALLCSNIVFAFLAVLNPTLNFQVGNVASLPVLYPDAPDVWRRIDGLVEENIAIAKADWDAFETSWDFKKHPLVQKKDRIADCFAEWQAFTNGQFAKLKANEEELNCIFNQIYGLGNEIPAAVAEKDVTIRRAELQRDIRGLISYAVGCMFGRYRLDAEGLAYAGGDHDDRRVETIIPITDSEYFADDIVSRFVEFVKIVFGPATLEENLGFIASALGGAGNTSREAIRSYFLKDFFKDHVRVYRKRPIYWLFDSGRQNGFKALIYMHRYNQDTVGRIRADYLHPTQAAIESAVAHCDAMRESSAPAGEKAKAVKRKEQLVKQLAEIRLYDQAVAHIAYRRIAIDLDDGVAVNYAKFQGVEVASEGKKTVTIDLLAPI